MVASLKSSSCQSYVCIPAWVSGARLQIKKKKSFDWCSQPQLYILSLDTEVITGVWAELMYWCGFQELSTLPSFSTTIVPPYWFNESILGFSCGEVTIMLVYWTCLYSTNLKLTVLCKLPYSVLSEGETVASLLYRLGKLRFKELAQGHIASTWPVKPKFVPLESAWRLLQ